MIKVNYPIHQNVLKRLSKKRSVELYKKLIDKRMEMQNHPQQSKLALSHLGNERGGDEADQVTRLQQETQYTGRIQRDLQMLKKITKALERMERGTYGICEQTGEAISFTRLSAIPWTTLSLEGAEELEEMIALKKAR